MFSAFMSAYWLAKHEVANSKLLSLLKLLETSGVEHMKYFFILRDIFLTIAEVIQGAIIKQATQATQARCSCILMASGTGTHIMQSCNLSFDYKSM